MTKKVVNVLFIIAVIVEILTMVCADFVIRNFVNTSDIILRPFVFALVLFFLIPANIVGYQIAIMRRNSSSSLLNSIQLTIENKKVIGKFLGESTLIVSIVSIVMIVGLHFIFENQVLIGAACLIVSLLGPLFFFKSLAKLSKVIRND